MKRGGRGNAPNSEMTRRKQMRREKWFTPRKVVYAGKPKRGFTSSSTDCMPGRIEGFEEDDGNSKMVHIYENDIT